MAIVHDELAPIGYGGFTSKNGVCVTFPIQNKLSNSYVDGTNGAR